MLDSARWRIVILGEHCGFHAKYIQKVVRKYDGQQYSTSTIYKVLKDAGVSLRDYRNGKTRIAKKRVIDVGASAKAVSKPRGIKLKQKKRRR